MINVVLVHGLWHGAWCWTPVTAELAGRGVASVAIDLDGHGLLGRAPQSGRARPFDPASFATAPSPVAGVTASSAAASLIDRIASINGGEPCIVVAHSMGGAVATAAAEREPSLFAHLVHVSAFAPVAGRAVAEYIGSPEDRGSLVPGLLAADPAAVGALRIDTTAHWERVRDTFYGDVDVATADAAIGLLTSDGPAGIAGERLEVTRERYGSVPHTYVACAKDKAVMPALQRRFIREIDAVSAAPTTVVELDSAHSPFLSQPAALAGLIARVAG